MQREHCNFFVYLKEFRDKDNLEEYNHGFGYYCFGFRQERDLLYLYDERGMTFSNFIVAIAIQNVLEIKNIK